jgi:hypothetical protein
MASMGRACHPRYELQPRQEILGEPAPGGILRADVKDLVFPGNLREIMNQVLEVERRAEAKLIEAKREAEVAKIRRRDHFCSVASCPPLLVPGSVAVTLPPGGSAAGGTH